MSALPALRSGLAQAFHVAQSGSRAAEPGHQRADRNAKRAGRFAIAQPLDRNEMEHGALFFRESHEQVEKPVQPDAMILRRRLEAGGADRMIGKRPALGAAPAQTVDKDIMQDGEQPGTQRLAGMEGAAPLIGAQQRFMREILGLAGVARQGKT